MTKLTEFMQADVKPLSLQVKFLKANSRNAQDSTRGLPLPIRGFSEKKRCKRCGIEVDKTKLSNWYLDISTDNQFCSKECLDAYQMSKSKKKQRERKN
jgi:hypothetical protein